MKREMKGSFGGATRATGVRKPPVAPERSRGRAERTTRREAAEIFDSLQAAA